MYYKYNPPFIPDTSNREFPAVFLNSILVVLSLFLCCLALSPGA